MNKAEKEREYQRRYRAENRERIHAVKKVWEEKNRERMRPFRREAARRYRERHRERLSEQWRERRREVTLAQYGLTPDEYDALLAKQGGTCAICRSPKPNHWSGRFQIDHDHVTSKVRGLLCSGCNGGLGLFKDDPIRLAQAIEYLSGSDIIAQVTTAFFRAS